MIDLEILNKDEYITHTPGQVTLKTCNRTEVYSGDGKIPKTVVDHLFRVVCGLKSSLVGEKAIQGQVKLAYQEASKDPLSSSIHKLFQRALYVGKRVRTKTNIDKGALSHSQAAVDILINRSLDLENKKITIVGAHNMNEKIIKYLKKKGANTIFLGNRTYQKAKEIADKYNSESFNLSYLREELLDSDILITATSAPHAVITEKNFPLGKEMTVIDLAKPRDVKEIVSSQVNVNYIGVEGVEDEVNQNLETRKLEILKAEELIRDEVEIFLRRNHGR